MSKDTKLSADVPVRRGRHAGESCRCGRPYSRIIKGGKSVKHCRPCHWKRARASSKRAWAAGRLSKYKIRRVLKALRSGQILSSLYGHAGRTSKGALTIKYSTAIVGSAELAGFRRANPEMDDIISELAYKNLVAYRLEVRTSRRVIAAPAILRDNGAFVFDAVKEATRHLPDHVRDDVRSRMFLALAEGRLQPSQISARVREFVMAQNRDFSAFVPVVGGIMRSLDQPMYDDSATTLADTVTRGLWQ